MASASQRRLGFREMGSLASGMCPSHQHFSFCSTLSLVNLPSWVLKNMTGSGPWHVEAILTP